MLDLRRQPLFEELPKSDGSVKGGGKNSGKATKCRDCGGFGHRAAQCFSSVREIEHDEEEETHGDVESVSEGLKHFWSGVSLGSEALQEEEKGEAVDWGRVRVFVEWGN